MASRNEMQSHAAIQALPKRLEAIENEVAEVATNLKLIEIGLAQLTTSLENVVMAIQDHGK